MKANSRILSLRAISVAVVCMAMAACHSDEPGGGKANTVSRSIEITEDEQEASKQLNKFAWRLLEQCSEGEDGNVVLSPLSADLCLSMLANATGGESRQQLLDALGFDDQDMANANSLNHKLAHKICGLDDNVTVALANSLWYDQSLDPKADFLKDLKSSYDIESYVIDHTTFARDVNLWSQKHTMGLIPAIVPGDIDKDFAVMNALYFKGNWNSNYKFHKNATRPSTFHNADGSTTERDFMCARHNYPYGEDETWSAIQLPFGGGGYRMTVVLPDKGYTIEDCLESIIAREPATAQFGSRQLYLDFPKFKMEKELDLIYMLKRLGVIDIFDPMKANLSNMTDRTIVMDLVKQKLSFEVNEDGAEAAAVTVSGGATTALPPGEPFVVDRPFLFMISEKSTGAILFLGRINKL